MSCLLYLPLYLTNLEGGGGAKSELKNAMKIEITKPTAKLANVVLDECAIF